MRFASLVLLILCADNILAKWFFDMQIFETCKGQEKAPLIYNNSKIFMSEGTVHVNYDIYVSRNLPNLIEATWAIEKCRSKENLNSCMPFYAFKTGKTCEMINSKGEMWTSFVNCIEPDFFCPIKKGVYRARNCTFDISLLTFMPLTGGYWKCKILMSDTRRKKVVACLSAEGEIRQKY